MSSSGVALNLPEPREPEPVEISGNKATGALTLRFFDLERNTPIREEPWKTWNASISDSMVASADAFLNSVRDYSIFDAPHVTLQSRHYEVCRQTIDELQETAKEPNWDSENAEPVSEAALSMALKVAAKLPGSVPAPEIYPDPEGRIEFDWSLENGTSFTLTVGPDGDAAMSAERAKGGFLRGWSKNDDDDDALPEFVDFSLGWLDKMAVK